MQWQPRDSPISSNSTDYLARTTSAPAFQILETMPATAPRAARGRTDAAEAVGCADLAPSNLAPLTSKINPPHFLSNNMFLVKKIRPLANHADFVSGPFLAEKTLLVGY